MFEFCCCEGKMTFGKMSPLGLIEACRVGLSEGAEYSACICSTAVKLRTNGEEEKVRCGLIPVECVSVHEEEALSGERRQLPPGGVRSHSLPGLQPAALEEICIDTRQGCCRFAKKGVKAASETVERA